MRGAKKMTITLLVLDLLRVLLVLFLLLYVLVLIENFYDGRIYRLSDENKRPWSPFGYRARVSKSAKELETQHTLLRRRLTLIRRRKLRSHKFAAPVQHEDQIKNPAVLHERRSFEGNKPTPLETDEEVEPVFGRKAKRVHYQKRILHIDRDRSRSLDR
jgi:hypothetical protein